MKERNLRDYIQDIFNSIEEMKKFIQVKKKIPPNPLEKNGGDAR